MEDYDVEEGMTNDYEGSQPIVETNISSAFRARFRNMGSMYARRLYDVDGNVLRDDDGHLLNVYTPTMNEYFADGSLRLVRSLRYDYRYFVRTQ